MKSNIKYSVIMPYYDRIWQFRNTLDSFRRYYKDREDFEIIVVEDFKNSTQTEFHNGLMWMIHVYQKYMKVNYSLGPSVITYNPVSLFNIGMALTRGRYVILTSPECRHEVDVFQGLDKEFEENPDAYVICGCMSIDRDGKFHKWYQHSIYRNGKYHFCSALSKKICDQIGGFDERFAEGYGYDDDAFRNTLEQARIPFILRNDLLVAHQHHDRIRPPWWRRLLEKNKKLYEDCQKRERL